MEMNNENNNNNNGNTVLLTVIGIATLLVALVGATFAYFSATLTTNRPESVRVETANPVGLEYNGNQNVLVIPNAVPGDNKDDTFTVVNPATSTVPQQYDLVLKVDSNTFTNQHKKDDGTYEDKDEQLQLTITATNTPMEGGKSSAVQTINGGEKYDLTFGIVPTDGDGNPVVADKTPTAPDNKEFTVVSAQRIEIGETHTYSAHIEFYNYDQDQNENMNKTFVGHIEIRNVRALTTTATPSASVEEP